MICDAKSFDDTEGHWAQQAIDRWSDNGILNGVGENKFNPDGYMTRAEAATVISRLLALSERVSISDYKDVDSNAWYIEYLEKCVAAGILNGDGNNINPGGYVTREMFFTMFGRAFGIQPEESLSKEFFDADEISSWAQGYTYAFINQGYVNGVTEDTVAPKNNINRASVITVLDRLIENYATKENDVLNSADKGISLVVANNCTVADNFSGTVVISAKDTAISFNGASSNTKIIIQADNVVASDVPEGVTVTVAKGAKNVQVNENTAEEDTTFTVIEEKLEDREDRMSVALVNSLYRLQKDKELNVAYFGGSVTNANGWRKYVGEWLNIKFRSATINNVNCSIGGTGSLYGVYRAQKHMFDYFAEKTNGKKPDLVFVEYAINDHTYYESVVSGKTGGKVDMYNTNANYVNIESIIRKIYEVNPKADIVFVITGDNERLRDESKSQTPVFGTAYTKLADYYNIPIIYAGRELAQYICEQNGGVYPHYDDVIWKKYYQDIVHPTDAGHSYYADTIIRHLNAELPGDYVPIKAEYNDKIYPTESYCEIAGKGALITDADMVYIKENTGDFRYERTSSGNFSYHMLVSENAGDTVKFEFNSKNLALWIWCYSQETEITYSIDGGKAKTLKLSMTNPNNRVLLLAENLDAGKTHTLELVHNDGNRFEIRNFMLSGAPEGEAVQLVPVY